LIYKSNAAQKKFREYGGLNLVLSYCATNFANPLSREWALLCIRNACENNIENQTFINELQLQNISVVDEQMLADGIKVDINANTGTFKFAKVEP
jgi:hypothetical protein